MKNKNKSTPFLKWAGGKRKIIPELKNRMPLNFKNYFEPFVGGGALFFEIQDEFQSFLSDSNFDLITTYNVVKNNPEELIKLLKIHQINNSVEYYYKIRSLHNIENSIERAARMIYLNKTCFNGVWRVNRKGEFNVPAGKYSNPGICKEDNIRSCSLSLVNSAIENKDYTKISPKKGDFVYFDPPYHKINKSSFTSYSKFDFTETDQLNLSKFCIDLHNSGINIMISNSATDFIFNLYKSNIFNVSIINAPRSVNCKSSGRNSVKEVLITNY